jgi:hypothetical protein
MKCLRLLAPLGSVLVFLACGTNDNTVASQPGSGGTGGATGGAGGANTGGASAGSGGVGSGGDSGSSVGGVGGGAVAGSGGTDTGGVGGIGGAGATAATGGAGTGGSDVGGVGGSVEAGGVGGVGGSTGGGAGTAGEAGAGGGGTLSPCEENADCMILPATCCGACGVATRDDIQALNQEDAVSFRMDTCGQVACPGCAGTPDPTLVATCSDGFCAVVDILVDELTTCTSPSDCRVRTTDCCECGGRTDPTHLIAVSKSSGNRYEELVCAEASVCAACLPQYPQTDVDCVNGHCQIVP